MTPTAPTILHIEDEKPIRRFVRAALEGEGWRVIDASTCAEGRALAASHTPDVIILDLGLPDHEGDSLIRDVREWAATPIIVVSARDQEADKVRTLDLGADDYLTKPFSPAELLARVRVALRHGSRIQCGPGAATTITVDALSIDLAKRRVRLGHADLALTPIEYRLLAELAKQPGRVFTHRALLQSIWGPGHAHEPHLVRVHAANLRKKLEADPARPRYLLTEPGVGYRLADE